MIRIFAFQSTVGAGDVLCGRMNIFFPHIATNLVAFQIAPQVSASSHWSIQWHNANIIPFSSDLEDIRKGTKAWPHNSHFRVETVNLFARSWILIIRRRRNLAIPGVQEQLFSRWFFWDAASSSLVLSWSLVHLLSTLPTISKRMTIRELRQK